MRYTCTACLSIFPQFKCNYLAANPHTLTHTLTRTSQHTYVQVISIFQNAVDFNSVKPNTVEKEVEKEGEKEGEVEVGEEKEEDPSVRRLVIQSSIIDTF